MSGGELIHLPNSLAKRIGPRARVFTAALLKRAEAVLERISVQYESWLRQDLAALDGVRADIRQEGATAGKIRELAYYARLLRGAGATFGYPIVTDFAAHLCDAIEHHKAEIPTVVLNAYVDAMKAAVREKIRDRSDPTAREILKALDDDLAGRGRR
jgi:hypothetical protein